MDLADAQWFKSTHSTSSTENGVEVAFLDPTIAVRGSRHPEGPILIFSNDEWTAFTTGVRDGQFDH